MRCLQLPFHFDPTRLAADLAQVAPAEWIPHMNRRHYEGQWSGAALRSIGGSATNIVPDAPGLQTFRDTALLGRCAYFREVLAVFRCPLRAVRLLRLHTGSHIAEHVDHALDFEDGEVRIHIPIITSEGVQFFLDGSRLVMAPGECWYTNVNLPHSVVNEGSVDRIHLVIDCQVDDWLRALFAATPPPAKNHYAARLELADAPAASALLGIFSTAAAELHEPERPVRFLVDGQTLVLSWSGAHTWQLRLHLPPASADTSSSGVALATIVQVESSPDPDGRHRGDYQALCERLVRAFPAAGLVEEGVA
jgi:aspartyl/asparaginyl beta-hydroxylase